MTVMKEEALLDPWKQEEHEEISGLVGGRGVQGRTWVRAFVVIFIRRNGQSGAGRFQVGSPE